jgi:hypothetical protein
MLSPFLSLPFSVASDPCILRFMKSQQQTGSLGSRRRPSKLSRQLADEKIERARRQTPEERLMLALHLSDFCYELNRCSPKP